ncbi:MAG TPA: gamma-glutamylcyclotransferase family protein [Allosphingosinicella sp.]
MPVSFPAPAAPGLEDGMTARTIALFAYGTLQLPQVQLGTYGRRLDGRPDAIAGFVLAPLAITDPDVVALSGKAVHMIARRSGKPEDRIEGTVFRLTPAELAATDLYEADAYGRTEVTLESGARAFAYIGPDL